MPKSHITTTGKTWAFPDDLLKQETLPSKWLVAHVLPRQEKRIMQDAIAANIPCLLFLERRVRRYPNKGVQESLVPLVSGYVFFAVGMERRDELFRGGRALRIFEPGDPKLFTQELQALSSLIEIADGPLMVRPEIVAGDLVEIEDGAFSGFTGRVTRREGMTELVVNLEILGTSVATRLPADLAHLADED